MPSIRQGGEKQFSFIPQLTVATAFGLNLPVTFHSINIPRSEHLVPSSESHIFSGCFKEVIVKR